MIEGVGVLGELGALLRLLLLGVGHGAMAREDGLLGGLRAGRASGGDEARRRGGERAERRVSVDELVERRRSSGVGLGGGRGSG